MVAEALREEKQRALVAMVASAGRVASIWRRNARRGGDRGVVVRNTGSDGGVDRP